MKPTNANIGHRFGAVWNRTYGEALSEQAAQEFAEDLLELGKIIYRNRIITRERAPP